MDGFAGNDPQPLSRREHLATQEPLSAFSAAVGYIYAVGEFRLPSQI